ncbi:MAG: hypothetical protein NZ951_02510 [Dehalococcoidia bacterium]|nr:hypothetical protein [Dehalococcoidia bacterium]MDW8119832.1 hypothetical protein [Chloroflexota bacterium]
MKPLEEALRRLRKAPTPPVDLRPPTAFDALLEQRIAALERSLEDLKGRVNGLIFLVVGAVVVQIVLGFLQ